MNTKLVFLFSAIFYMILGLIFIFLQEEIIVFINIKATPLILIIFNIIGVSYISIGMLNWMLKDGIIGGIYNKPAVIANFSQSFIITLSLFKIILKSGNLHYTIYIFTGIYFLLSLAFWKISRTHPKKLV